MHDEPSTTEPPTSVLATLRRLIPTRLDITFAEALQIAEVQAARLLALTGIDEGPIPDEVITELPRIRVIRADLPVSGLSHWNGTHWVITLNASEPRTRHRFTLAHEYKHIIDHGSRDRLYRGSLAELQSEKAADYFAACLLMPRLFVKRAWGNRLQQLKELANHFDVSLPAMRFRLEDIGLLETPSRRALTTDDRNAPDPSTPARSAA